MRLSYRLRRCSGVMVTGKYYCRLRTAACVLPLAYRRSNNALLLSGNHVLLRTDLSERLPIVQGDSVQLQQVLLNLILNAADALADVIDRPRDLPIVTPPHSAAVRVE